jgi:AcrR family transcriptional regulator
VERILEAARELLGEDGVDALTMRSLAERTGIPVASIYRYFDNRDEIIAAYLDRELEAIEAAQTAALLSLERVTFRSMAEAGALAHMRHHQQHPEGVPVWFGGRLNAAVVERVRTQDARLAASFQAAVRSSGLMSGVPDFMAELLVRLFDRMFEFVFLAERTPAEQEAIVLAYVDMISAHMETYATPAGEEGISAEEFVAALLRSSEAAPSLPEPRPVSMDAAPARARARVVKMPSRDGRTRARRGKKAKAAPRKRT